MRVALIGAGSIGERHLANLQTLGHEVVVIDADPTRGAYRKLSTLCGTLDAAIIATPAETHLGLLRDCIAWGLPVLVEKPLGTVADLPTLRDLRPTTPVMVGYNWRFHPEVQPFLARHLSRVVCAHFRCDTRMSDWPGSAQSGDPLLECSHDIDLACQWANSWTLRAAGELDGAGAWLQFDSVVVDLRWDAEPRRDYLIIAERPTWLERYAELPGMRVVDRLSPSLEALDHSYRNELAHFLRAVEGGPIASGCTLQEGIAVLDVVRQVKGIIYLTTLTI